MANHLWKEDKKELLNGFLLNGGAGKTQIENCEDKCNKKALPLDGKELKVVLFSGFNPNISA
ncbi:MAG TPA: hypothetical protein VJ111_13885 [Chitinophagaceae bacterium]|nr:hypothetical protein [Chitinophagaceae bacterium]